MNKIFLQWRESHLAFTTTACMLNIVPEQMSKFITQAISKVFMLRNWKFIFICFHKKNVVNCSEIAQTNFLSTCSIYHYLMGCTSFLFIYFWWQFRTEKEGWFITFESFRKLILVSHIRYGTARSNETLLLMTWSNAQKFSDHLRFTTDLHWQDEKKLSCKVQRRCTTLAKW